MQVAVLKLIQQTLFQLGELSDDKIPTLKWKTDMSCENSWSAMREELAALADELQHKPREHKCLVLLGQVASYAGQWDSGSRVVARKFASLARSWADDLKVSIESMDSATESEQLALATERSKCCLFYMYSIVCHGVGYVSAVDLRHLCELSILAENCRLF